MHQGGVKVMALKYRGGPTSDSSIVVGRREARRVAEQCRHDANAALNLSPFTPSSAGRQEVVIGSQSQPHLEDGSVYRQLRPTRLDEIKNFHSLESIDTENSDTRGRSGWVHSSRGGALRQSRALQQPAGEGGAVGTGVARNLGIDPRLVHPKLSQTSRDR